MSLTKVSKNFQITLPARLRKMYDLKEGDYLEASIKDGAFIFKPIKVVEKAPKPKPAKVDN